MKRMKILAAFLFLTVLLKPLNGLAFETPTHRLINQQAALGLSMTESVCCIISTFDDFLGWELQFPDGLGTLVNGQSILEWIRIGGAAEDQFLQDIVGQTLGEIAGGVTRSPRHFHTPLRHPWDQSGLNLLGIQVQSSVQWAQNSNQSPGVKASWEDARDAYFAALTLPNQADQLQKFADTFKLLGQLMHLVADLASPPHTRNDPHLLGDGFEAFMAKHDELVTGVERQGVDPSILRVPTGDPVATVPVARLWDTNRYDGNDPGITTETNQIEIGGGIEQRATMGLAEFTSANFFSDDTITRQAFSNPVLPFPAIDRLSPGPIDIYPPGAPAGTGKRRQYLSKLGDGVAPINHMAAEGLFVRFTPPFLHRHVLDDWVYQDYAANLLPRAIGYAGGVLDYFFRGRIEYDSVVPLPSSCEPALIICASVWNASLDEETEGTGEIVALVRCCLPDYDTFFVSQPVTVTLTREPQTIAFTLNSVPPPGVGADTKFGKLYLIYRGPLGKEQGAVFTGLECGGHGVNFQTQFNFSFLNCGS